MFEGLRSLAGLAGVMKDLPRLQAAMEETRREIAAIRRHGRAGGGAVTCEVSGSLELLDLRVSEPIAHALADPAQRGMATSLVVEAINDGLRQARAAAAARAEASARAMGLPIPPGGILPSGGSVGLGG